MIVTIAVAVILAALIALAVRRRRDADRLRASQTRRRSPDLEASLHSSASMLSCDRHGLIELKSGTYEAWLPQIVCPTFIRNEMVGALIFGPKTLRKTREEQTPAAMPCEYTFEEKELVQEFAHHISTLLRKDPRAGNR